MQLIKKTFVNKLTIEVAREFMTEEMKLANVKRCRPEIENETAMTVRETFCLYSLVPKQVLKPPGVPFPWNNSFYT